MIILDCIVSTTCPFCGEEREILVNEQDYCTWMDGELALRDAFPYLSAEEREMLMSGICPTCWDSMWGNEEDDEENFEVFDGTV